MGQGLAMGTHSTPWNGTQDDWILTLSVVKWMSGMGHPRCHKEEMGGDGERTTVFTGLYTGSIRETQESWGRGEGVKNERESNEEDLLSYAC